MIIENKTQIRTQYAKDGFDRFKICKSKDISYISRNSYYCYFKFIKLRIDVWEYVKRTATGGHQWVLMAARKACIHHCFINP